jgi:hypothetical protein
MSSKSRSSSNSPPLGPPSPDNSRGPQTLEPMVSEGARVVFKPRGRRAAAPVDEAKRPAKPRAPIAPKRLPDLAPRQADELVEHTVATLVAGIRAAYSAEHRVYARRELLDEALAEARERIAARRAEVERRLRDCDGDNAERVRRAWNQAMLSLGDIYLQEQHWSAEPEHLFGVWRRQVRVNEEGAAVGVSFLLLSGVALAPTAPLAELEGQALPEAIEAVLQLVDWSTQSQREEDISLAEAEGLARPRDRLVELLAAVPEPLRSHYRDAFNAALAVVTTGEATLGAQVAPGPRLAGVFLR